MQIIIQPDGNAKCVYDEAIDVNELGVVAISRGSHVEPDSSGQWLADLGPVSGPMLGPFALRSDALDAEREWLQRFWLTKADPRA
jgi:hypothetical protein